MDQPAPLDTASQEELDELYNGVGVEALRRVVTRWGRNEAPYVLQEWWEDGRLSIDDLRGALRLCWTLPEWPQRTLGVRYWVHLFKHAGFVSDPPGLEAPTQAIQIFRGASTGHERGMSWTTSHEIATWFARRFASADRPAVVLETVIPPRHVLAQFSAGRKEEEVVVNVFGLHRETFRIRERLGGR